MTSSPRAIIHIETSGKSFSRVNYSRRMYAIIRRYTPDVAEGKVNECYAELTGLRTFYKLTYKELASRILGELKREIGISFTIRVATVHAYEEAKNANKKPRSISTYKELNSFFSSSLLHQRKTTVKTVASKNKPTLTRRKKLTVPFLGKVS
jgi:hypothetical protein